MFAVLAFLQGLAPVLHAHMTGTAAPPRSGVHMPVRIAHAGHAGAATDAACATSDESGIVTVPPEIRRHRPLILDLPCIVAPAPWSAMATVAAVDPWYPVAAGRIGVSLVVLPPARGPPATA